MQPLKKYDPQSTIISKKMTEEDERTIGATSNEQSQSNSFVRFNESLAYLFYAVAAADRNVRSEEMSKIKGIIEKDWAMKRQGYNSNKIIYAKLNHLAAQGCDAEYAMEEFERLFLKNRDLFPESIKKRIFQSVENIALSFAGRNKSESLIIYRLYKIVSS